MPGLSFDPSNDGNTDEDPWLGSFLRFPTVLHARASFGYEINASSLQKAIFRALRTLADAPKAIELSLSDYQGYLGGAVSFQVGVGNGDAFDILDRREEERLTRRIEEKGPFNALDLAVHAHYKVEDGRRHAVREDRFLSRLLFRAGHIEMYVHHIKGMRRVQPEELIRLLIGEVNGQLEKARYPRLEPESFDRAHTRAVKALLDRRNSA